MDKQKNRRSVHTNDDPSASLFRNKIDILRTSLVTNGNTIKRRVGRQTTANTLPNPKPGWLNAHLIGIVAPVLAVIFWLFFFLDEPIVLQVREIPRWVHDPFDAITDLGKTTYLLIFAALGIVALSLADWQKFSHRAKAWFAIAYVDLLIFFYCVGVSGLLSSLIKNTLGRARPKLVDTLGPHHFDFALFDPSFASFPSGHSTTFGATCMVLLLRFPQLAPLFVLGAVIGAVSRVIVGAHYPSDVLVGVLFGAGFTLLTVRWLAHRNIAYRLPHNSFVLAFPTRKTWLRPKGTSLGLHHDLWNALRR